MNLTNRYRVLRDGIVAVRAHQQHAEEMAELRQQPRVEIQNLQWMLDRDIQRRNKVIS